MHRRRTALAFALSLAIHVACLALLVLALWHRGSTTKKPASPAMRVALLPRVVVVPAPAQPPAAAEGPSSPAKRRSKVAKPPPARAQELAAAPTRPPAGPPPAGSSQEPAAGAPAERPLTSPEGDRAAELHAGLLPSIPGTGSFGTVSGDPDHRGHTLHNDPSELPDPKAVAAADGKRIKAELDGFISDELASLRVENGLVDPYFSGMRASLEKAAANPPMENAHFVQKLAQSWLSSAEKYAQTGNPYGEGAQPETSAQGGVQTPLEREAQSRPGSNAEGLQQKLDSAARLREFADGKFGNTLLAIVEIRQAVDGRYESSVMLQSSGNRLFDSHVLKSAPSALQGLPPPAPQAAGVRVTGIRSTWAFEGRVVYKKKASELNLKDDWWYLAAMAPAALATGSFEETTGDVYIVDLRNPKFVCKVKLLKVY